MAKPPVFNSGTWHRQKALLAAEDGDRKAKESWKAFAHGSFVVGGVVFVIAGIAALILSFVR